MQIVGLFLTAVAGFRISSRRRRSDAKANGNLLDFARSEGLTQPGEAA